MDPPLRRATAHPAPIAPDRPGDVSSRPRVLASYGTRVLKRSPTVGALLLAAAVWTWLIWITRLVNMAGEDRSAGFLAVHGALAVISMLLALPVAWVGLGMVRRARHS
jgi:hypothetical protein